MEKIIEQYKLLVGGEVQTSGEKKVEVMPLVKEEEAVEQKQKVSPQESIFCTNCGAKNPTSSNFCYKCGTKLTKVG